MIEKFNLKPPELQLRKCSPPSRAPKDGRVFLVESAESFGIGPFGHQPATGAKNNERELSSRIKATGCKGALVVICT